MCLWLLPKARTYGERLYKEGVGIPGLVAVYQDATGKAMDLALAYGKGIGCTRGYAAYHLQGETETDLFGEQCLCGGLSELIRAGSIPWWKRLPAGIGLF